MQNSYPTGSGILDAEIRYLSSIFRCEIFGSVEGFSRRGVVMLAEQPTRNQTAR